MLALIFPSFCTLQVTWFTTTSFIVVVYYVHEHFTGELNVAGAGGVEPPVRVLETRGLPLTDAPLRAFHYSLYLQFAQP